MNLTNSQFILFKTEDEKISVDVRMNDDRLKNLGGGGYWKELLQRIQDIRASEKVFYHHVNKISGKTSFVVQ